MSPPPCDRCPAVPSDEALCPACGRVAHPGAAFGKYAVDREVGRGSMGVVYDARDATLGRRVALKILFASAGEDPKEALHRWTRFMQEARLTALVAKHPGIVTLFEAAVHQGRRYLAMEYVSGEPFARWRGGRSVREQVRVLREVALAVHHAHEHGIIHRDLKPANVLVQAGGRPVVSDFGLATQERRESSLSLTPSGFVVGSPAYMSPEQARGQKDVGRATDVWALGVMLYEIVASTLPFEGRTPVETLSKVMQGSAVPPSRRADVLEDPVLDAVCLKAMAPQPEQRHPTALAFAEELDRWLGSGAPSGRRPRYLLLAGVGGAIGILLVAAAWLVFGMRDAELRERLRRYEEAAQDRPIVASLGDFRQLGSWPYVTIEPGRIGIATPATVEGVLRVPDDGLYDIIVAAGGRAALGVFPRVEVRVDGERMGEVALTGAGSADYTLRARLRSGERRFALHFANDYVDEKAGEDRNLVIYGLSLRRVREGPTPRR